MEEGGPNYKSHIYLHNKELGRVGYLRKFEEFLSNLLRRDYWVSKACFRKHSLGIYTGFSFCIQTCKGCLRLFSSDYCSNDYNCSAVLVLIFLTP